MTEIKNEEISSRFNIIEVHSGSFTCPNCLRNFGRTGLDGVSLVSYILERIADKIDCHVCNDCLDYFLDSMPCERAEMFEKWVVTIGAVLDE